MSVKRFVAADMRRALELVRQEMGPEAIILSSRRVKQGVEILTSLQAEPQPQQVTAANQPISGLEVPMDSDDAWRQQALVDQTLTQHTALQRSGADAGVAPIAGFADPNRIAADAEPRGQASGKTPAELAAEMERAREKMIAARKREELQQSVAAGRPLEQQANLRPVAAPSAATDLAQRHDRDFSNDREQQRQQERRQQDQRQQEQRHEDREQQARESREQQAQLQALQSELADMRLLLEEQLSRMSQTPQQGSTLHTGLMRRLQHMGFVDSIAARIVAGVSNCSTMQEAWSNAQAILAQKVPASSLDPVMEGGMYAFVGPTGVGKTTTIAKLAARYVLEHGSQNVTLVTTDTYRIAAHDQLRSLGRILNVQVKVVDDNQDLPYVLRTLRGCPLVLVDTAGFRQGDGQLKEQLDILASVPDLKTMLVMASNSQLQMLKASIHAHQSPGLYGCVLTKLDETASLGEALSVVMEHGLTVYYSTNGQEIPQDLAVAKGHKLVASAISLMKSGMGSLAPLSSSSSS
ncbi:flagellar biosynthesis protein FlhF [Pseudomaricurvus alcaniphilus]|uniref:flagellar biosynthesis protein FlhF n=1 Tax=Pseudomaricurvus alcaniphilus TaxID=1166482 RepID=UPI00140976B1|nr:flagellar biosynthesis protein FlhF [Pseudomaricurvus alcaniphilus]NHN39411.1 flagellar biosynthesis protein FlhF [Pseudomaricurvus alcaniphilus]